MPIPVGYSLARNGYLYKPDGSGPYLWNPDGTVSQVVPRKLLTDKDGASARIRVDPGQTGFFAGRMFRTYREFVIPVAGPEASFRFTSLVDFILWSQKLDITQGALRAEVFVNPATSPGPWTAGPVIGVNRMAERPQPYYVSSTVVEFSSAAGAFTGGTPVDLLLLRSAANQGNSSSQNAGGEQTERGLPAGVYYIRLSTLTGGVAVTDNAQGVFAVAWEERVP